MDGKRQADATSTSAETAVRPPSSLDVDAMLATMKQSAAQLDGMMQRLCAARVESAGDAEGDSDGDGDADREYMTALQPMAQLQHEQRVGSDAYFEAIRTSFNDSERCRRRIAHQLLRRLLLGDQEASELAEQAVCAEKFRRSTTDVTYMFPTPHVPSVDDEATDDWDMAEALTLNQFEQRVKLCLDATDHLMPPVVADVLARHMATAILLFNTSHAELQAIEALFPVASIEAETFVEWRRGNRICKIQATERERHRQWGLELVLTVDTVARAQAHVATGATTPLEEEDMVGSQSSRLGPALSCSLEARIFVPKALYKSSKPVQLSPTTSLQIMLTSDKVRQADPADVKASEKSEVEQETTDLPEFLHVYQWGGHATLTGGDDSASTTTPAEFDASRGFQKLDVFAPFPRNRIVQAACGRLHTLLLNDMGMVFSYGHAMDGALGHGDALRRTDVFVAQPKLLQFFFEKAIAVQSVACGGDDLTGFHSAAVTRDGAVFTWGVGIAVGLGSVQSKSTPERVKMPSTEVKTSTIDADKTLEPAMVSVACGSGFCVALSADGSAFAWGKWSDGRLGLGAIPVLNKSSRQHGNHRQLQRFQGRPKRILLRTGAWRKVSCGDAHCLALARDGRVYVWGRGRQGQLGLGDVRDAMTPVLLSKKEWRDVAAGSDWSMAADKRGAVWAWGASGASVLGLPGAGDADRNATIADVLLQKHLQLRQQQPPKSDTAGPLASSQLPRFHWLRPQPIPSLSHGDAAIRSLAAGVRHAAAVSERGDLYVWGSPHQGLSAQPTLTSSAAAAGSLTDHAGMACTITERVFCGGSQMIALTSSSFLANAMQQLHRSLQETRDDDRSQSDRRRLHSIGVDVALVVGGGKALLAHKLVLCRRSVVLRELILNEERPVESGSLGTTASNSSTITEVLLPQLRLDIARVLLEFLYTDNLAKALDPFSYLIRDVLRAARQFQIPRLVQICRERIASAAFVPLRALLADLEVEGREEQDDGDSDAAFGAEGSLNHDLAFAFGDETWSDLKIIAESRAIPVHRCMLIARSEYFRALLAFRDQQRTHSSANGTAGRLEVEESYLGMIRVLNFIYNDGLTTLGKRERYVPSTTQQSTGIDEEEEVEAMGADDERTEQLLEDLIAADKYSLVRMKRLCEHHIVVTRANCLDVLVVADLVHAEHLKLLAMAFVQRNLHALSAATDGAATSVIQRLTHEFPHLLAELYDHLQRHTQQQSLLRDWQRLVERDAQTQQDQVAAQWQATSAETTFPWLPLLLAFVFATLYLSVMNAHESDLPLVPAINLVVVVGLLAAAFMGKF